MKKNITLILSICFILASSEAESKTIKSRILNSSDSIPVELATISLVTTDSITVDTDMTDKNGYFTFEYPDDTADMIVNIYANGSLRKNVAIPCDSVIYIDFDTRLTEITVSRSKQLIKGTARGLDISMDGNPLAKLGNAMEMLKQLPMIDSSGNGISVIGHGSPLIYINNRKLRNMGELSLLSAGDVKNVEIITNPSSKYGSNVGAVLIIHTKKRNPGLHTVAEASVSASEECSGSGSVSLNYHTESGMTYFGDFSYGSSGFRQERHYIENAVSMTAPYLKYITETYANARSRSQSMTAVGGFNFDFGKNSTGIRYSFYRTPISHYSGTGTSITDFQDMPTEITSLSRLINQNSMHHVNAFANIMLPKRFDLRVDADYVATHGKSITDVDEDRSTTNINNTNKTDGHLWAGKITLSRKFDKVELEVGTDISYTISRQNNTGISTETDLDFIKHERETVKQKLYAGYVSFDWNPDERWNVYGGLRLESTNTDFHQNETLRDDLSKKYTHFLPNFGVSFNSGARISLYYRAIVSRPSYRSLDNTYLYVTPTLWETGNAELQSTLIHRFGLNINYRKFILQSNFAINKKAIGIDYSHDNTYHINIEKPVNMPTYNSFQIVAVQQLDFSFWHPSLQGLLYLQKLRYGSPARKYNKPLYNLSINNRFDIPGGIYAYLNISWLMPGYQGTVYTHGFLMTSLTINKTWKNWTFTLSATDPFNTWRQKTDIFTNTVKYSSNRSGASRSINLSIRYTLNAAGGKYKGRTSRQDEVDRL